MIFHGQEFLGQDPFPETIPPLDWSDAPRYVGILEPYRDLIGCDGSGPTRRGPSAPHRRPESLRPLAPEVA